MSIISTRSGTQRRLAGSPDCASYLCGTLLCAALVAAPANALAYEAVAVTNGGLVTGSIKLSGKGRRPRRAALPAGLAKSDKHFCGKRRPLTPRYYRADKSGNLADVVVWLADIKRGRKRTRKPGVLANRNCRFVPLVQSIDVGAKVRVENHDPIMHNTHPIYVTSKISAFNIGMPRKGQKLKKKIRRAGVMRVQCDAGHVWMRAWVHAFKHPYHVVTKVDGTFSLQGVPPGTYTLKAWHERSGTLTRKVSVQAGKPTSLTLTFKAR